ncbi:hypothetical protein SYNTR_0390 [Candidatus Syntrophocurvum alkaliphilum]|uniref:Uncharacterized protein n=1 Tax=Candidatus Syntrophocurvum alkaliphilum TaxID=2293317 RepID=A0A6I6D767_9FIRM|nr:hypothetical protein [Candidatus Syntrophocurvum alkaliphilum]QGT98983.1 hypothetical protein SYNTR_0390 [Candidatus Syntrophocurvum alkaliphilum]
MKLLVVNNGFVFTGNIKDLKDILSSYPSNMTLREFINNKLN